MSRTGLFQELVQLSLHPLLQRVAFAQVFFGGVFAEIIGDSHGVRMHPFSSVGYHESTAATDLGPEAAMSTAAHFSVRQ